VRHIEQGKWRTWTHHHLGQETWLFGRSMVRKTEENVIQRKIWETQRLYCVQWERQKKMWFKEKIWETQCLYCVQWENGYGMQAGEQAGARSWTMKLVDSGRVLNGAPQFVGRQELEIQWQADVGRVRPSRSSGCSACQVLCRSRADLLLER
jgi:hypothetical protein